jgi:hypothetical protein
MTVFLEAIKNNKWLAYLALATALVCALGNTIVSCVAYFQPKVTFIQSTVVKSQITDKSKTTRHEIMKPDGSVEKFEEIQNAIDNLSYKLEDSKKDSTPVPLRTEGQISYSLGYGPLGRDFQVKVGFWFTPSIAAEISNPVLSLGDSVQFGPLAPVAWLVWRP